MIFFFYPFKWKRLLEETKNKSGYTKGAFPNLWKEYRQYRSEDYYDQGSNRYVIFFVDDHSFRLPNGEYLHSNLATMMDPWARYIHIQFMKYFKENHPEAFQESPNSCT